MTRILTDEENNPVLPLRDVYYYFQKLARLQRDLSDRKNAEAIQQTRRDTAEILLNKVENCLHIQPKALQTLIDGQRIEYGLPKT